MYYDLNVKNGRVIDPVSGKSETRGIYVHNGRIAPPPGDGSALSCGIEVNAEGCYVAPGFIDDHLHCHRGNPLGGNPDCICLPCGVTTAIDPGSTGAYNIGTLAEGVATFSETNIKALVHVNPSGVSMPPYEEPADPRLFDKVKILEAFRKYPHMIKGIKIRATEGSFRNLGLAPLRKAVEIADYVENAGFRCPLVMHFSALPENLEVENLIDTLRPGDVFAHLYQPTGKTIFDSRRKLLSCMEKGRKKGILFDSACSTTWSSVENLRDAFRQGFMPDIIGTDIVGYTRYKEPVVSLPNQMSFFMNLGMTFEAALRAVTVTPAKVYGILDEAGTLAPGAPADIAIFQKIECEKTYSDRYGGTFTGNQMLLPWATIRAGNVVFVQAFMRNKSYY